ncbi:MAG: TlpA disulfide reductase family protein, partial [Pedobacter sp.]|nr:TlpA disulfide reductase family protein [Pedobacter sp.]
VRDESGILLPYVVWQKMVQSGDFGLQRPDPAVAEYQVYKLSTEERQKLADRKKAYAASMPRPRASDSFVEGRKFDGEKITDMNGNKFDLRNADGKIYVLNFWFINCPPCKKEIPELNEMVAKYKDNKNVVFLAIALDNYRDLKDFLETFQFNYHIVDDGRYFADKYKVKGFPTHVVVGRDGLIKFSTLGLGANTVYWVDKTITEQLASGS